MKTFLSNNPVYTHDNVFCDLSHEHVVLLTDVIIFYLIQLVSEALDDVEVSSLVGFVVFLHPFTAHIHTGDKVY